MFQVETMGIPAACMRATVEMDGGKALFAGLSHDVIEQMVSEAGVPLLAMQVKHEPE